MAVLSCVLNVLTVISGLIEVVPFATGNFAPSDKAGPAVRIAVSLDTESGVANVGGHIPRVLLYGKSGEAVTMAPNSGNERVNDGQYVELVLAQERADEKPVYGIIVGGQDPVCIAYVAVTSRNGPGEYVWTGSWGHACGASWYYSNTIIGRDGIDNNYSPRCTWVGGNMHSGVQIYFPDYLAKDGKVPPGTSLKGQYCENPAVLSFASTSDQKGATRHRRASTSENSNTNPQVQGQINDTDSGERPLSRRQAAGGGRLVVSTSTQHSARELCNSKTSVGPDLFSRQENQLCRMSDKKLFPVCGDYHTSTGCFDVFTYRLVRNNKYVAEFYVQVIDWTQYGKTKTLVHNPDDYEPIELSPPDSKLEDTNT
jgi:hypothetical protein